MENIKQLRKKLREWKSQEVRERFEQVGSTLHLTVISELKCKINQLKTTR